MNADGPTPGTTVNYNGPVIQGDANGARLAWGNRDVDQSQTDTQQIAPGFEPIAQAVAKTLEQLSMAGLPGRDQEDAEEAAKEVLAEVTQPEPNQGKIRRALAALKHLLAPVAAGASSRRGRGCPGMGEGGDRTPPVAFLSSPGSKPPEPSCHPVRGGGGAAGAQHLHRPPRPDTAPAGFVPRPDGAATSTRQASPTTPVPTDATGSCACCGRLAGRPGGGIRPAACQNLHSGSPNRSTNS